MQICEVFTFFEKYRLAVTEQSRGCGVQQGKMVNNIVVICMVPPETDTNDTECKL